MTICSKCSGYVPKGLETMEERFEKHFTDGEGHVDYNIFADELKSFIRTELAIQKQQFESELNTLYSKMDAGKAKELLLHLIRKYEEK